MTPEQYAKTVMRTAPTNVSERELLIIGALGLAGEAGETVDTLKKYLFHGHEFDRPKTIKELGDFFWYAFIIMNAFGITFDEVSDANDAKLRARYPEGFDPERSINRKAGDD